MEVYILFDEEFGECIVFLDLADAKAYFDEEKIGGWKQPKGDDSLWMSNNKYVYIFRREIVG
jgi:hypothetical protein